MANYGTILVVDDNTSIFTTLEICLDGVFDRILTLTITEMMKRNKIRLIPNH